MGIHYFYGKFVSKLGRSVNIRSLPTGIEGLLFDLNGLLHAVAQRVFLYGAAVEKMSPGDLALKRDNHSYRTFEAALDHYAAELTQELNHVISSLRPKQYLVIAVDGVAPGAKIAQQRSRRYVAAETPMDVAPTDGFLSSMISPGTAFMQKVDSVVQAWISKNRSRLPPLVVYSPHTVFGEGEHKAFAFLREALHSKTIRQGDGAHIVYGMDSDLLMLSIASPVRNIYLSREDLENNVNVDALFTVIKQEMTKGEHTSKFSDESLRHDFIVISTLLGNDFIPHSPAFEKMVPEVFAAYNQLFRPLVSGLHIHASSLANFYTALSETEAIRLAELAVEQREQPDAFIEPVRAWKAALSGTFNIGTARKEWYGTARTLRRLTAPPSPELDETCASFGTFVQRMVADYLGGVAWVLRYYLGGGARVNWLFSYRFMTAPLLSDLAGYLGLWVRSHSKPSQLTVADFFRHHTPDRAPFFPDGISEEDGTENARGRPAIGPIHQLLAIIPPSQFKDVVGLVRVARLQTDELESISPTTVRMFREGARKDYLAAPVLPEVNLLQIVKAVTDMETREREYKIAVYTSQAEVDKRRERMDADGMILGPDGKPRRPKPYPTVNDAVPLRLTMASYTEPIVLGEIRIVREEKPLVTVGVIPELPDPTVMIPKRDSVREREPKRRPLPAQCGKDDPEVAKMVKNRVSIAVSDRLVLSSKR